MKERVGDTQFEKKKFKRHAKTCKNVQKRAAKVKKDQKTCISRFFGPYSKMCTVEVRAA